MYYWTIDGRQILDGVAGLWCVNAGHGRREITQAVAGQLETLDCAPTFQMGHPAAFQLANELVRIAPSGLDHAFFTNSGSEAVDTALKIAIAFHRLRGQGTRTRLIGRERAYHGVGFGGISVGGIPPNRKTWSAVLLPAVDHLPHTHDLARSAFSRGSPEHGAHLAEELERLVALHDASNIAAVIVEPIAGSTGVLIPPRGYLQRLREICTRHGILLILDEVITGFGRTGSAFAAQEFGVTPDMITLAQGAHQRLRADGRGARQQGGVRHLHAGSGRHRAVPRLHLFGPSRRLRRGARDTRAVPARRPAEPGGLARAALAGGRARAACHTSSISAIRD
jgi:beta-alanine--pyruvate transaminase